MPVTAAQLAKLLPTVDRTKGLPVLLHGVLKLLHAERDDIPLHQQLKAGLWEFMLAVGFISDSEARALLAAAGPSIEDVAVIYAAARDVRHLPVFEVVFAEKRWATWPGQRMWFDFHYERVVECIPEPAVLKVSCDLTALYLRQRRWLEKLGGGNGGSEHHAGGGSQG